MLNIQVLTLNNEKNIEPTLQSILPLKGKIYVCDLGSCDNTIAICKKYTENISNSSVKDKSKVRNDLLKDGWMFYIDPGEVLVNSFDIPAEKSAYHFQVLQNNIITKEVRLWHSSLSLSFSNPIEESMDYENSIFLEPIIYRNINKKLELDELDKWCENNPTISSPFYYKAFYHFQNKEFDKFLYESNNFLFREKDSIPANVLRYYCAMVLLYVFKKTDDSLRLLLHCLSKHCLMAEFWCLAGDIVYARKEFEKASSLYENAILLGSKRLKCDKWPMDISKYRDYPNKMMDNCKTILRETKYLKNKV